MLGNWYSNYNILLQKQTKNLDFVYTMPDISMYFTENTHWEIESLPIFGKTLYNR
jgi:hypothetical protein